MQRFTFGRNWTRFSRHLDSRRFEEAIASVRELMAPLGKTPDVALDLGCGSGLFSIALARLGAARVVGVDLDSNCVRTALSNAERFLPGPPHAAISFLEGSVLDAAFMRRLPQGNVVYAWGSLHHTGNLRRALELSAERVKPNGLFIIAVYNRCATAPIWRIVKRVYRHSPAPVQAATTGVLFFARASVRALRGRHPFRDRRGMSVYVDAHDWLGGYPYEFASPNEIEQLVAPLGFTLVRANITRGSGCNEFVFQRDGE